MDYYRRNLPHWHLNGTDIFVTWRLLGSLPRQNRICVRDFRGDPGKQFVIADRFLDGAKSGPLWLADAGVADYVSDALARGADLGHYDLHAWVIMPNHVHLLLSPRLPLKRIMNGLKCVSARDGNAILNRVGKRFWQDESFDHWVRGPAEHLRIRLYIERNPVKAGLVKQPEDWRWPSAWRCGDG